MINPAEPGDVVGYVREATEGEVSRALDAAAAAGPIWFATPPTERAAILERAAELMESQLQSLLGILVREAGKTFNNAIAEVREAVDFLHYYAGGARRFRQRQPPSAGPSGLHQPVELPAGDLHRPNRRGAGGGQQRAGQTGRANAIGSRAGSAHPAGSRHSTRRAAAAAGRVKPSAQRWLTTPASAA